VLVFVLVRYGFRLDWDQLRLQGVSVIGFGPALILAMFSFVGFESATTLGTEARNPLQTIPRVVIQCAILAGLFFILCGYSEVVGFRGETGSLSNSTSPMHVLANKVGISALGTAIDMGACISMIACTLACTTAGARVLLRMAHSGLVPDALGKTHPRFGTPGLGVVLTSLGMFLATVTLAANGVAAIDLYGWLGSISVFGFLTAYGLVAVALPYARKAVGQHSVTVGALSGLTVVVMVAGALGTILPLQHGPPFWFPFIYAGYMAIAMAWFLVRRKTIHARRKAA
jgi:amino acid transporter